MKIAILGDFHFGYDRFYDDSFTQAARALNLAQDKADLILVAGDIFDTRVPKQETVAKAFEILAHISKKVIVIHGTHERRPQGFTNPVDLLCKAGFTESCHAKQVVFEKDGEKVAVYGLAGVPEEYAKAAIEKLAPKPIEGALNIFMFHQNLKEFMPVVEHGLTSEDLPPGFDLYVDGHLHKNQELRKQNVHLLIPGSTVLTQLRREEAQKGFYVYDTKERKAEYVAIDTRPFIYRELALGENADIKSAVQAELSTISAEGKPIVRLDISGISPSRIDMASLNSLQEMHAEKLMLTINIRGAEAESDSDELRIESMLQGTIRERGMAVLKGVVVKNGHKLGNVEELFEMACDAEDEALRDYVISSTTAQKKV